MLHKSLTRLFVMGLLACSSPPPVTGEPDSGSVISADLKKYYAKLAQRCSGTYDVDPLSASVLVTAQTEYAAGKDDIALSASGCTRLLVQRKDGQIISETIVGPPFVNDPIHPGFIPALRVWTYETTGYSYSADSNSDGFFESRGTVVYEKSAVFEDHAAGNDAILARNTVRVSADGKSLGVTQENASSGTLGVKATFSAALTQATCAPNAAKPKPIDFTNKQAAILKTRPCTSADETLMHDAMSEAVIKGSNCLHKAGLGTKEAEVLHTFVRTDFKLECATDLGDGIIAVNDRGYRNLFPGKARVVFHDNYFSNPSPGFRAGTTFHELLHFTEVHDPDLESAADENAMRLADPVYGCEYACFSDLATVCHLAACLKLTVNSGWMTKCMGTLSAATIQDFNQGRAMPLKPCKGGKQVGALCKSSKSAGDNVFCTTEMECNAACAMPCESKSISCDPTCR